MYQSIKYEFVRYSFMLKHILHLTLDNFWLFSPVTKSVVKLVLDWGLDLNENLTFYWDLVNLNQRQFEYGSDIFISPQIHRIGQGEDGDNVIRVWVWFWINQIGNKIFSFKVHWKCSNSAVLFCPKENWHTKFFNCIWRLHSFQINLPQQTGVGSHQIWISRHL